MTQCVITLTQRVTGRRGPLSSRTGFRKLRLGAGRRRGGGLAPPVDGHEHLRERIEPALLLLELRRHARVGEELLSEEESEPSFRRRREDAERVQDGFQLSPGAEALVEGPELGLVDHDRADPEGRAAGHGFLVS